MSGLFFYSFLHFFWFSIIKLIAVCNRNIRKTCAWVAELVDARDLKSLGAKSLYEFKSRPGHQKTGAYKKRYKCLFYFRQRIAKVYFPSARTTDKITAEYIRFFLFVYTFFNKNIYCENFIKCVFVLRMSLNFYITANTELLSYKFTMSANNGWHNTCLSKTTLSGQ